MKTREHIPTFREALEREAAESPEIAELLEKKAEGVFSLPAKAGEWKHGPECCCTGCVEDRSYSR